jgi:glutamate-5-semialdehyde dehydrogenase
MRALESLAELTPGMPIVYGGDRVARVSPELAARFAPGDALLVVERSGELLHVPAAVRALVSDSVGRASAAFAELAEVADAAISRFFLGFAQHLADDARWAHVLTANAADVERARGRGLSTTRLAVSATMRAGMIEGLRGWAAAEGGRGERLERIEHAEFQVDLVRAALGVVGFVFESRPNVLADATGVLRGGNSVVFRIGSAALGTADAIMRHALTPALGEAGLPLDAVVLIASPEHAAGYALFTDPRLALAVARGSGPAVDTLGTLAQQTGVPVSLHGTGGAWLMAAASASRDSLAAAVVHSLDRKVCNTLNTCCIVKERAAELVPIVLAALERAGQRRSQAYKLHVVSGSEGWVPAALFEQRVKVRRAEGDREELCAEIMPSEQLGREWEWEETPEMSLVVVDDLATAVRLFNRYSPHFVASLISAEAAEHERFFAAIDAPFVGDGFTRWVDGQVALRKPELGLSNWQRGRLFGRGGVLSGDTVFTVRTRYITRANV